MEELYGRLYDLTDARMCAECGKFITTKNVFLTAICSEDKKEVNLDELFNLDESVSNEEFLNIIYLRILNRAVGQGDISSWEEALSLPKNVFRMEAMRSVVYSGEAKRVGKKIVNNNVKLKTSPMTKIKSKTMDFAYSVYMRFPEPIKKIIRKIRRK